MDYQIAREAARVRAATGMRTPDALILATAVVTSVDIVVTNDAASAAQARVAAPGLWFCLLSDHILPRPSH